MAEDKKSFILYCDQKGVWDKLDNEQAGRLIKHILAYVNDENPTAPDFITELAFEPIKQQLKRDLKEWDEKRQSRSTAGKAGAEARWQKIASDGKRINSMAKMAVNVNVNDNVNVTVNDNVNVNDIDFIIIGENKIFKESILPILEFYEAQLNGMQKEHGGAAWRGVVDKWFMNVTGDYFKDNTHVKNSFKKYYLNVKPERERKTSFNLDEI